MLICRCLLCPFIFIIGTFCFVFIICIVLLPYWPYFGEIKTSFLISLTSWVLLWVYHLAQDCQAIPTFNIWWQCWDPVAVSSSKSWPGEEHASKPDCLIMELPGISDPPFCGFPVQRICICILELCPEEAGGAGPAEFHGPRTAVSVIWFIYRFYVG